jgi:hypothetical protein
MSSDDSHSDYNVVFDSISEQDWTKLLCEFDDAHIYQSWSYGKIHFDKSSLHHCVSYKNSVPIALAQISVTSFPLIKSGIAYCFWGPLWKKNGSDIENARFIIQAMFDEYVKKRGLILRIRSNAVKGIDDAFAQILINGGFKRCPHLPPYRSILVDLCRPEEQMRKEIAKKWRHSLNKAERQEVKILSGTSEDLMQYFVTLYDEMKSRKGFSSGVDIREFCRVQSELPDRLKTRIMVCLHQDKPVSATIGSLIGKVGIGLLSATNLKGRELNASYLLQWKELLWIKEQGAITYDLNGINPQKNPGVYNFKAGLSSKEIESIGTFDAFGNRVIYFLFSLLEKIRSKFA